MNFSSVDVIWTLLGAALVYFMQAGFAMCEAGLTRAKNTGNILMKNMMDFCIGEGKHAAVPAFAHLRFIARGEPGRFSHCPLSFRGEHGRIRKNAGNGEERENAAWNERARSTKPMWRF